MTGTDEHHDPPGAESSGRIAAARLRVDHARASVVASRTRFKSVDVAFELSVRDAATGGAVLAGAIAFRLFLWTLPASLVAVGILGFNTSDAKSDATDLGLGAAATGAVSQAAAQAHRGRWVLVIGGAVLLISVSRTLAVTVRTAVALTWQQPIVRKGRYLLTAVSTAAIMAGALLLVAFTSWLRHQSSGLGIAVSLVTVLIWTAAWWGVSAQLLPHPPLPWWGTLPGAALVGVGMEIMHLIIVFYLTPKVTSASALYGSLGTAATLLLGAFLLARIMLASAALNATVHVKNAEWSAGQQ